MSGRHSVHEHDLGAAVVARDLARERLGAGVERDELHARLLEQLGEPGGHHAAGPGAPRDGPDEAAGPRRARSLAATELRTALAIE